MKKGFTLAEILITLGIIGIIASMTIPSLIANYRKKLTVTRLKASYSILSQAIMLSITENNEYTDWDFPPYGSDIKDWVNKYIAPYLEYTEIGISADYTPEYNERLTYIKLKNGTIICLHIRTYVDFIIDINGIQGPNKQGYDQFTTYLNINNTGNTPKYLFFAGLNTTPVNRTNLLDLCATTTPKYCGALIQYDNWEIKKDYPHRI